MTALEQLPYSLLELPSLPGCSFLRCEEEVGGDSSCRWHGICCASFRHSCAGPRIVGSMSQRFQLLSYGDLAQRAGNNLIHVSHEETRREPRRVRLSFGSPASSATLRKLAFPLLLLNQKALASPPNDVGQRSKPCGAVRLYGNAQAPENDIALAPLWPTMPAHTPTSPAAATEQRPSVLCFFVAPSPNPPSRARMLPQTPTAPTPLPACAHILHT